MTVKRAYDQVFTRTPRQQKYESELSPSFVRVILMLYKKTAAPLQNTKQWLSLGWIEAAIYRPWYKITVIPYRSLNQKSPGRYFHEHSFNSFRNTHVLCWRHQVFAVYKPGRPYMAMGKVAETRKSEKYLIESLGTDENWEGSARRRKCGLIN